MGLEIHNHSKFIVDKSFNLPIRLIVFLSIKSKVKQVSLGFSENIEEAPSFSKADLLELGIVETISKEKRTNFLLSWGPILQIYQLRSARLLQSILMYLFVGR